MNVIFIRLICCLQHWRFLSKWFSKFSRDHFVKRGFIQPVGSLLISRSFPGLGKILNFFIWFYSRDDVIFLPLHCLFSALPLFKLLTSSLSDFNHLENKLSENSLLFPSIVIGWFLRFQSTSHKPWEKPLMSKLWLLLLSRIPLSLLIHPSLLPRWMTVYW